MCRVGTTCFLLFTKRIFFLSPSPPSPPPPSSSFFFTAATASAVAIAPEHRGAPRSCNFPQVFTLSMWPSNWKVLSQKAQSALSCLLFYSIFSCSLCFSTPLCSSWSPYDKDDEEDDFAKAMLLCIFALCFIFLINAAFIYFNDHINLSILFTSPLSSVLSLLFQKRKAHEQKRERRRDEGDKEGICSIFFFFQRMSGVPMKQKFFCLVSYWQNCIFRRDWLLCSVVDDHS